MCAMFVCVLYTMVCSNLNRVHQEMLEHLELLELLELL